MEDEPKFIKFKYTSTQVFSIQVPLHPGDRLRKNDKIIQHLRNRLTHKKAQIAKNNVSKLMRGEFFFSIKNILYKTLLPDTSKINKEIIMDKIIESLNDPLNDEYYMDHPDGTNSLTLKQEDGR